MIQVYHNNRCGKSREAVQKLEQSGKEFEIIKYLEHPPTFEELKELLTKLNYQPLDLVRQKESVWIENFKGKNLSDDAIIHAMIEFPILIERPIIIFENTAIVARPVEKLNQYI
ncbi:arsenate reductase family protein [Flavobacterium sp.]|uniref:arsenate reductase family protein n=1 Tax=Flavobacterium sp. TaxID=239 RepID=UPI00262658B1|nr:arsenate reductase family protein [Flavobacterium sp.]MDD3003720.1 arsenate reductase family protein [Flavobacterium sp.]